jgi:hypothetical protein
MTGKRFGLREKERLGLREKEQKRKRERISFLRKISNYKYIVLMNIFAEPKTSLPN